VWQTDRQTDGRTDILPRHSPRYAYASRGKNNLAFVDIGQRRAEWSHDRSTIHNTFSASRCGDSVPDTDFGSLLYFLAFVEQTFKRFVSISYRPMITWCFSQNSAKWLTQTREWIRYIWERSGGLPNPEIPNHTTLFRHNYGMVVEKQAINKTKNTLNYNTLTKHQCQTTDRVRLRS